MKRYEIYILFLIGLFLVTGCPPDIKDYCDSNEECIEGYLCNKEKKCIEVEQEELQVTIESIPLGVTGEEYNLTIFVEGGLKPYFLNINTELEWLTYDEQSNDGFFTLHGVPNEKEIQVPVDIEVMDNTVGEGQKVIKSLSLTVLSISCNPIVFNDSVIEAAVRQAIGKATGDILQEDILSLTELDVSESEITDIRGIQCLTKLTDLNLNDNQISDISALANLTDLMDLGLYRNPIINISSLMNLTNMMNLRLGFNQITDVNPLKNLTNLTYLSLESNQISDISPLMNLTNLTQLWLGNVQISNISALADLTNLTLLCLWSNQISDISTLTNLTNLTYLYLDNNQISDIGPLTNLINLIYLCLDNNQISDIGPLVDNSGLSSGDEVYLTTNSLNCNTQASNIKTLRDRGIVLETDCD